MQRNKIRKIKKINIKNNIRSYEKMQKRILSAKYGIIFNQIYLDNLPNLYQYIYIYIYNLIDTHIYIT